jgi:hypothetical protein
MPDPTPTPTPEPTPAPTLAPTPEPTPSPTPTPTPNSDADSEADANPEAEADDDSEAEADADTEADSDDSEAEADADTEADSDDDSEAEADADTEADSDPQATGQDLNAASTDADREAGGGKVGEPAASCDSKKVMIKIRLFDVYHKPMVGTSYQLEVDGQTFQGETGGDGIVSQEVEGNPTSGKLTLDMWSFDLTIEPLDPADSQAGSCVRLDNLGYYADDASMALMRFQSANDLDASGQMNDETKAKLTETHGN